MHYYLIEKELRVKSQIIYKWCSNGLCWRNL